MRTLVIGMGITGRAVAAFLSARQTAFDSYDDRIAAPDGIAGTHHFTDPTPVDPADYDRAIVSPGLRLDHPLTVKLQAAGVTLLSEIELAFAHAKGPVIAITGSNGKSTCAAMTHHLLSGARMRSSLCGNIGVPFIERVDDDPEHIYVVEVSSFQLERVIDFKPAIAILLNVAPDHLDWHGSFEAYEQAKLRLFARQDARDLALVAPSYADKIPGQAVTIAIPGEHARLTDDAAIIDEKHEVPLTAMPLPGPHNHLNALFACYAARHLGVSTELATRLLPDFRGLEHRMERLGEWNGRLWINDSKATNVHAARAAIESMTGSYVLILGGCDKKERFGSLRFPIEPRAIIAYGETADLIAKDLADLEPVKIHAFREACLRAQQIAEPGDTVLLAPACASFDQFDNFGQRGKVFKEIFEEGRSA